MRVFVTGATGYIGSAIVRELLAAGHQVVGLARSDTAAAALKAAGAEVHRGNLDDLDSLRSGAVASDGVIHTAFNNISTTDFAAAGQADLRAVEAIGAALEGSGKPFMVTSGTLALAMLGRLVTEEDVSDPALPHGASENAAIALAERGVRSSVHCSRKGRVSLRRRWIEPLACRASTRCGAPVPAGRGSRPGWLATARSRRGGRAVPGNR